jgi:hypothetical protein
MSIMHLRGPLPPPYLDKPHTFVLSWFKRKEKIRSQDPVRPYQVLTGLEDIKRLHVSLQL